MNLPSLARPRSWLLLLFFAWIAIAAVHSAALPSPEAIGNVLAQLSLISGMPVRRPLRFHSITRLEVARFLEARTRQSVKPKQLDREQAALEFLGLLPAGFDLRKLTIDLMTEQAAAFYDYHKKALFLSDWAPESMRDTAMVHELAHALADQNFSLDRFERRVAASSDQSTARQAVIEGQASYLMLAYAAGSTGKPAPDTHPNPASFDQAAAPTNGQYPVFDHAPLFLRVGLIFPYTWGVAFQAALVDRLSQEGFKEPFRHPPVSTQQILHPELYFAGRQPVSCKLPETPHGYRVVFEGDFGELDHRVLIQQFVSLEEAKRVSPHWRGGSFRLLERKADRSRMLLYASQWEDETGAAAFWELYRKCLEGKSKSITFQRRNEKGIWGQTERGYFRVTRNAARIEAIEGAAEPLQPS